MRKGINEGGEEERKLGSTYFEIMLPGKATLSVCDLPPRGVNTAVGFEVSCEDSSRFGLVSCEVLRFCRSNCRLVNEISTENRL